MVSADGFMMKPTMQASASERTGVNDMLVYTVVAGDSISAIAQRYGLNSNTIAYSNGLNSKSTIKVGQQLIIPPVDGLVYKIDKDDSLSKIADKFKVNKNDIIAQNKLTGETLAANTTIIIPGAKPPVVAPTIIADAGNDSGKTKSTSKTAATKKKPVYASLSTSVPKNITAINDTVDENDDGNSTSCKGFAWPVSGGSKVTQSFSGGHPALDIQSNSHHAPIVAARAGVIVQAEQSGYNGGYGKVVVIDHGNGIKTRYAHNSQVLVSVGDRVSRGQVIAYEGNTGRVYGKTGIHSHFEVMINGKKVNPRVCY